MERLFREIQYVKGVGPKRHKQFSRLGVETAFDLLWHMPRSYINRGRLDNIAELKVGESASLRGVVKSTQSNRTRNGMTIFKAVIQNDSGIIQAVWFNQRYIANYIKTGQEIYVSGKVKHNYGAVEINVSDYEVIDSDNKDYKVLPVYALTEGLNQKIVRNIVLGVLQEFLPFYPDIFDETVRNKYELCSIEFAFHNIHFPSSREAYIMARKRLAFEELFLFQLSIKQTRPDPVNNSYVVHNEKSNLVEQIYANLPFQLTGAQQRVIDEIFTDMKSNYQMNRLIQGDVGSGKTVVAALAMAKSVASGYQAAIMAPTEILAEQHFKAMSKFFYNSEVVLALLTGGTGNAERRMILDALSRGEIDIVIGTHALIQNDVYFDKLGLVIIDEQHRFGVKQRAMLSNKGSSPDILVMTATPIPRTLALTVYGDLELSVIDELPPGRKPIKTIYMKEAFRSRVYKFIQEELKKKSQVYIVCPLVEESEKQDLQAAVTLYEKLKNEVFVDCTVGLLHGRLKSSEKDYIMDRFKKGAIQILVSTTVIEVGVDVPNASIMVIEQAERFGLSQLHQLRGRVGRGNLQSYCFLIGNPKTEEAFRRLKAMEKTNDGFKLAQEDLMIRGPGDFWGVRQHGLDQLKIADLTRDQKLVEASKELAGSTNIEKFNLLSQYIDNKFKKSHDIARN